MVDRIQLTKEKDRVKWKIGTFGQFRVKDLYLQMRAEGSFPQKFLWKTKIPMKVKIFLWLMIKCSVLTKDNLLRRGWTGDPHCKSTFAVKVKVLIICYSLVLWPS
jgi:hypothetical protein